MVALASPANVVLKDVEYTRTAAVSLRLDASIPAGEGPFPTVIIVHGGGWVRGDRRYNVEPLFEPLSAAGFAWFSISYRLTTNALEFGVAIHDVEEAIRFVKMHAEEYRVDPSRIALMGESAGGQLAAMAALGGAEGTTVRSVVAIYTPSDLVALARDSELIPEGIRRNLKGSPFEQLIFARLAQLSPMEKVTAGMPPFLFIHGTADPVVPFAQSTAMCARMRAAGASCEVFTVEGGGHGVRAWEHSPARANGYKREMVRWLREQMPDRTVMPASTPVL